MPSQPNDPDPIVTILQEAARRGFEIMRQREQIKTGEVQSVKNTKAPDEGPLRDDGANANSRNARSPRDKFDERTPT
jgi:hypothetical protein